MNEKKDNKRNEVIVELQRVAALLQTDSLAMSQFAQYGNISLTTIARYFGSWNKAVQAAGLETKGAYGGYEKKLSDEELLRSIIDLTIKLGKKPTQAEMEAFGGFSIGAFRTRWGTFSNALQAAYAQYGFPLENTTNVLDTEHPV